MRLFNQILILINIFRFRGHHAIWSISTTFCQVKKRMKFWWNGEIIMYDRTIIENKTETQKTHFGWKLITECNIDNFWSGQLIIMLEPQQITVKQIQRTYHRRHHSQTFMNFSIFLCVVCIACLIGFILMHISHTFLRSSCDRRSVAHTGKKPMTTLWSIVAKFLVCRRLWSTINLLIMYSSFFFSFY